MGGEIVVELGCGADGPDPREEGEAQVPECEGASPAPGWFGFHEVLAREDEDDVGDAGVDGDHGAILHPC